MQQFKNLNLRHSMNSHLEKYAKGRMQHLQWGGRNPVWFTKRFVNKIAEFIFQGGIVFLSDKKCPWKIPLKETEIYYYDKKVKNIWNPKGNGWRQESSEKVSLVSCLQFTSCKSYKCLTIKLY